MKVKILIVHLILFASPGSLAQVSQAPLQNFSNAGGATGTMTSGIPTYFSSMGQPLVIARPVSTSTGGGVMTANELMFPASTVVAPLPTAQPTALVFSFVATTSLTASFTAATGSPAGYIVLRKLGSAPVALPSISVSYTAGFSFADVTVAYVGPATTFNDAGLIAGTNYFYAVFSFNGSGATLNYLTTSPLAGNQATLVPSPTISNFNPPIGTVGTSVTITGTNFDATAANNIVKFNGTTAVVTASTATSITTSVPIGATTGTITVTVGGQTGTSSTSFTVDNSNPTFGTNSTAASVAPGSPLPITADFIDPESNVPEALVQYRSVSATGNTLTDAPLTKGSGNSWTGSILAAAIGELGVEYKFKIKNGVALENTSQLYKVTVNHESGIPVPINSPFTKAQSSYRIIAVPLVLTSNTVNAVFSDEFGTYDENVWRMYHYESGNMNKLSGSSALDPGKGYWFISTKPPTGSITTGAGSTVPASFDQPFEITLTPGWNQIGNPYNFDVSWQDVRNANPGLIDNLRATARSYNGSVIEIDEIKKFEGAYVSFTGTTSDKIKIPVTKNMSINGRIKSNGTQNPLDHEDWKVKFNLSNGLQQYTLGGVGMHPQANEGVDRFDDFNIPRFFEHLEVKHPKDFFDMSFTMDIVPTQDHYVWNFTTETNQPGDAITLDWDNSFFGKGSEQLWLMDVETGAVWDMRKENSVSVDYAPVRRWRVAFGSELYVQEATLPDHNSLMASYPNPFNGEISIELAIVEPSAVKLEILDLNGKNVTTLISRQMDKGRYVAKWVVSSNGSDETASGIYIVRLQAGTVVQHKRIMKN